MRQAGRLNTAIKVGLLVAMLAAAYYQVFHQRDLHDVLRQVRNPLRGQALPWFLLALVLVPLNWGLESAKWRRLINSLESVGARKAFSAVLSGVTLGLFTPNRIGEYGGRLLYLEPRHRWTGVSLSLVGSYAQNLITLFAGTVCGSIYLRRHPDFPVNLPDWAFPALALAWGVALFGYVTLPVWAGERIGQRLPRRIRPHITALKALSHWVLFQALIFSAARFLVFTAQYLVLLRVYGVSLPPGAALTAVGTVFLLQSVLPSFAAVELLKRGNIALLVFGFLEAGEPAVLATSSTLWLINLVLPALVGYVLLIRRDFFRTQPDGT
ncbi:MAG: hypothetical protein GC205_13505 [Bacteroidetes bacterium]|nr:hypothetical protein [Bacteroidota bacterium]